MTNALASRILFDHLDSEDGVAAYAAEFIHADQYHTVKVGKEVILSAGYVLSVASEQRL